MLDPAIPAGQRGTFVPDNGAPVRAVVIVSHADGRVVIETQPASAVQVCTGGDAQFLCGHCGEQMTIDMAWPLESCKCGARYELVIVPRSGRLPLPPELVQE